MNEKLPVVSIGMPVYNGETYIREALDSLLNQDFRNFELIVSDNASTDQTSSICREYAQKDQRVRYTRNETNIGAAENFLNVLALARGDHFMWAACDDLWTPDFVSSLMLELERYPDAAVAMSAVERVTEEQLTQDVVRFEGSKDPYRMGHLKLALALASGKPYHLYIYGLYRTAFLRKAAPYFPNVAASDRLLVCQLALATRFRYVDRVLHVRKVKKQPIHERFENDPLGSLWKDPLYQEKLVAAVGPYLWRSPVIPLIRKFHIPLIVAMFSYRHLPVFRRFHHVVSSVFKTLFRFH